jgi:hypothetical protein
MTLLQSCQCEYKTYCRSFWPVLSLSKLTSSFKPKLRKAVSLHTDIKSHINIFFILINTSLMFLFTTQNKHVGYSIRITSLESLRFLTYKIHSTYSAAIYTFCLHSEFHLPDSNVSLPTAIKYPLLKDTTLSAIHCATQRIF